MHHGQPSDLSDINVCSELPCCCAIGCENSCSISCTIGLTSVKYVQKLSLEDLAMSVKMTETIGIVIDEFDGLVESVDAQHAKHWSKNLLFVCLTILYR